MKGFDNLKRFLFGAGETVQEDTPGGYKSFYREIQPNIIQRIGRGIKEAGQEVRGAVDPTYASPKSVREFASQFPPSVQASYDQQQAPTMPQATPVAPMPKATPPPHANAAQYLDLINSSARSEGIPEEVLYKLLARESIGFRPDVISGKLDSPAGARGIAQFMPATAESLGVDPLDPNSAIPGAAKYLGTQLRTFDDLAKALAAYNAGPGAVRRYGGVPPYEETQKYVEAILGGGY